MSLLTPPSLPGEGEPNPRPSSSMAEDSEVGLPFFTVTSGSHPAEGLLSLPQTQVFEEGVPASTLSGSMVSVGLPSVRLKSDHYLSSLPQVVITPSVPAFTKKVAPASHSLPSAHTQAPFLHRKRRSPRRTNKVSKALQASYGSLPAHWQPQQAPIKNGSAPPVPSASLSSNKKGVVFPFPKKRTKVPGTKLKPFSGQRKKQRLFSLQQRRQQKKKQVLWQRFKTLLRMVFTVLCIIGLVQAFRWPGWQLQPRLNQVHLTQSWLSSKPAQVILNQVGTASFWSVHPEVLAQRLKQAYPMAQEVWVQRRLFPARLEPVIQVLQKPWAMVFALPHTVLPSEVPLEPPTSETTLEEPSLDSSVSITEPEPTPPEQALLLKPLGLLLERNPKVLPLSEAVDGAGLQRLPGLIPVQVAANWLKQPVAAPVAAGHVSSKLKSFPWEKLQALVRACEQQVKQPVRWVQVLANGSVLLGVEGLKVKVGKLDGDVFTRVQRLSVLLQALKQNEQAIDSIDLRWHNKLYFTAFKKTL